MDLVKRFTVALALVAMLLTGCREEPAAVTESRVTEQPATTSAPDSSGRPMATVVPMLTEEPTVNAESELSKRIASVSLTVEERAGYDRSSFQYAEVGECNARELARQRDLDDVRTSDGCKVTSGTLFDPYTGRTIEFERSEDPAAQVDHIVPMSYAWRNNLDPAQRVEFGNDLENLIVVDAGSNQDKGDQGPSSWLPPNEEFHCEYAERFSAIVLKYDLTLLRADKDALLSLLDACA